MAKQDSSNSPPMTTVENVLEFAKNIEYKGNSLTIWRDFKNYYDEGEPIPDAILQYFSEVASNLLAIENPKKSAPARIQKALKIKGRDFAAYQSTYKRETLIVKQLKAAKLFLEECGWKGNRENATELISYEKSELLSNKRLSSKHLEFMEEQKNQLGESFGIDTVKTIHDKYMSKEAKIKNDTLKECLSNLLKKEE